MFNILSKCSGRQWKCATALNNRTKGTDIQKQRYAKPLNWLFQRHNFSSAMVTMQPLCGLLVKRPGQTSFEHKLDLVFAVKALASHQQNHHVFYVTLMHLHALVIVLLYILVACIQLCGIKRWSSTAVMSCQAVVMLVKQLGWQQRLPSLCSCRFSAKINSENTGRTKTKEAKARQPRNTAVVPLVLFRKAPGSPPPTGTSHSWQSI